MLINPPSREPQMNTPTQVLSDAFISEQIALLPDDLAFVTPYFAFARAIEAAVLARTVPTVDAKDEREAFEAWWREHYENTLYAYAKEIVRIAWQARAALAQPSAAKDAPATPAQSEAIRTHTTQAGESVMGIALRQCGNEAEWRHILACNPQFADWLPSDYFPVGTILTLPPAPQPAQIEPAADVRAAALEEAATVADMVRSRFSSDGFIQQAAGAWCVCEEIRALLEQKP
jgi:hypothetical protein